MDIGYRESVIESLKKIFKDKSYSNLVINNDIKNIDFKYFSLYRKSVLGVVENLIFIDWIINQMSNIKTKKMEYDILIILRLAVYQIFFLDNSYENIVVNESVQYIKNKGNIRASKFVNAVLRNIIRNKENLLKSLNSLPYFEYLSVEYSYPEWLIKKWDQQFGKELENVLSANNSEALLEIRVNTLKISKDELIKLLNSKGFETENCRYAHKGIIIKNPFIIEKMEEYKSGFFSIQSESSMLVAQVLNPKENRFLVDLCSAPGGKSLNAAENMNNKGSIIGRDIYENKLSLIDREAQRLGINIIKTEVFDASVLDENLVGKADYCIADVPCTGLGIIRRKPDIKYNKSETDLKNITKLQYKILENASKYLKPNGEMVYSTCTTNKEENINIIKEFINNNKEFCLKDISNEVGGNFNTLKDGYMEIYPHINQIDGFFIAKIKRL